MTKLCFVPEILVFVREMSLKFDFWGRHACPCVSISQPFGNCGGRNVTDSKFFQYLKNFFSYFP